MSASGSARDRVRATPFDTALNAEAAATHKPVKLKATTFFGGDLPVPAARLDENKQLVTDRAFKPDTANAYIIGAGVPCCGIVEKTHARGCSLRLDHDQHCTSMIACSTNTLSL